MNNQVMTAVTNPAKVCLLCVSVSMTGCASWSAGDSVKKHPKETSLLSKIPFVGKKDGAESADPYPNPVKMAATWTPDTLTQTGRTPTRGFGGRIFFYNERSQPVPVDGTLVVHGFDDSGETEERKLKRFEFTPEQFTRHFSQTDLGASYSVWLPWDAVGGDQRRISLVASFKTSEGEVVQGIPATVLLPGKNMAKPAMNVAQMSPQYQRYLNATASAKPATGMVTTTITRRRGLSRAEEPALNIPAGTDGAERIAIAEGTPAMDLGPGKRKAEPTILPASATETIRR